MTPIRHIVLIMLGAAACPAIAQDWQLETVTGEEVGEDFGTLTQATAISKDQKAKISIYCGEGATVILLEKVGEGFGLLGEPAMLTLATDETIQRFYSDNMFENGNVSGDSYVGTTGGGVYVVGTGAELRNVILAVQETPGNIKAHATTKTNIGIFAEFSSTGSRLAIDEVLTDCIDDVQSPSNTVSEDGTKNSITQKAEEVGALRLDTNARLEAVLKSQGFVSWELVIDEGSIWRIVKAVDKTGRRFQLVIEKNGFSIIEALER